MRIGTWNVEYASGVKKNDCRLEVLRRHPADIWILTETHDDLDLGPGYKVVSSKQRPIIQGERNVRHGSRWATIWSSFPILKELPVRDKERTVAALLGTPLGAMIMFGTVLPWQHDRGKSFKEPGWSEFYRVIDEQSEEWNALRRDNPNAALCVAGDLNHSLSGPNKYKYWTSRGRKAMHAAMEKNDLFCTTEEDLIPEVLKMTNPLIDHVLVPKSFATNSRIVATWEGTTLDGVRLSDHSGLVVDLAKPNP